MGKEYQEHLRSTLNGNKNAFTNVVLQFRPMALAVAAKSLHDRSLIEDATQEAFFTAYRNLDKLRDLDAFPAWFRAILKTVCRRIRNSGPPATSLFDEIDDQPSNLPDPLEVITRFQDRRMVLETLAAISGTTREACLLRYVHGLTYKEIAETLSIPPGTIKRRLHDAREQIIRRLKDETSCGIRIGYMPISDHLLAMVAHHRHDQHGFQMHLHKFLSWTSLIRALRNGVIDAAFLMAPMAMALKNDGESILYILDGHHDGSAIAVQGQVDGVSSLSRLRIGLPHVLSTHSMLLHGLLAETKPPSSFEQRRYFSPSFMIRALREGRIDAFFCAEPWSTKSALEGSGRILLRSREVLPGHVCCVFVVRTEFSTRCSSLVQDVVKLMRSAGEFITTHPGAGARIHSQYTGIAPEVAEQVLCRGDITFTDLAPDRKRSAASMNLALRTGLLERPCAMEGLVSTAFV